MDAQSLPEYGYEPLCALDAVRVVVLKPAKVFEDPLRCDIIQYSRSEFLYNPDSTAHYAAVSYTWGEPVFSEHILCNDDTSIVRITPNASSLLRHLRKQYVSRYLWIDAICLNQEDLAEKAVQIPLMGNIYETAKKVRIWLGDADKDTAKVFAFLRCVKSDYEEDTEVVDHILEMLQKVFGHTSVDEIERFLGRAWFSRRWIIQEVLSALHTTVHCGNNAMPFPWFTAALKVLHTGSKALDDRFLLSEGAIAVLELVETLIDEDISIMELLWKCHTSDCRDPQDRHLAFYGLLSSEDASKIPFNYTSHWAEFFRQVALGYAQDDGGNALLYHVISFGSLDANKYGLPFRIPSWVPDWTGRRQHTKFLGGPDQNLFFEVGTHFGGRRGVLDDHLRHHPSLKVSKVPGVNSQALEFEFYSFGKVENLLVQASSSCNIRDVPRALSTFFSLSHSDDDEGRTKRFVLLISEMLHLSLGAKLKKDYIAKYSSKSERERFLTEAYDVAISIIFHHFLDIWEKLAVEDYPWSPGQVYLLDAVSNLLQTYSLFYLSSPVNSFGLGPRCLQKDDLVVPLYAKGGGSCGLFEEEIADNKAAVTFRLDDANSTDLPAWKFRKGRILGACFCCFKRLKAPSDFNFFHYFGDTLPNTEVLVY